MTAVMRIAEARLNASSMSKSSIKLLLPGAEVDCRTNTSAPRTFSLISTLLSPSLNVSTTAFPKGTLRYWLISAARGGLEFPANIFSSAIGSVAFVALVTSPCHRRSEESNFYPPQATLSNLTKTQAPFFLNGAMEKNLLENTSQLFSTLETGWAGRIRTFDTGSKVRGLTAWRPPIPEPLF